MSSAWGPHGPETNERLGLTADNVVREESVNLSRWNPYGHGQKIQIPFLFFCFVYFVFCFLWPDLWHMEVPRLGIELELKLPAYTTVTADPSCVWNLHHSSWQHWILNPPSEVGDQIHILMDTSEFLNLLSHNRNSWDTFYLLNCRTVFHLKVKKLRTIKTRWCVQGLIVD